jgi:uncharacterized protein
MFIKISGLSEGVHNFSFDEKVSLINLEDPFFGNFKAQIELSKTHNQIILNTRFSVKALFECDRCANNFEHEIDGSYKMVYFFGNKPSDGENKDENLIYLHPDADRIEIGNDLRDFALLSVPMKKLCREDCKGLCIRCGKDLNEGDCDCDKSNNDARWLPLQELKNKIINN